MKEFLSLGLLLWEERELFYGFGCLGIICRRYGLFQKLLEILSGNVVLKLLSGNVAQIAHSISLGLDEE